MSNGGTKRISGPKKFLIFCLAVGILIGSTSFVYYSVEKDNQKTVNRILDEQAKKTEYEVNREAIRYQNLLKTVGIFFNASGNVSSDEFTQFVTGLDISSSYPGVKGIAYAQRMQGSEVDQFVKKSQEAGVQFQNLPTSDEGEHAIMIYSDPVSEEAPIGMDIYNIPGSRESLNVAAANSSIMSGEPIQFQINGKLATGYILAYPVAKGMPFIVPSNTRVPYPGWAFAFIDPSALYKSVVALDDFHYSVVDKKSDLVLVASKSDDNTEYLRKFTYTIGSRDRVVKLTPTDKFLSKAYDKGKASRYAFFVLNIELIAYLLILIGFMHKVRRHRETHLTHQAAHDTLTGLPNRFFLEKWLTERIAQSVKQKQDVAVLFIDLDGFKAINDTLGHQMGDEFLVAISQRLQKEVRERDILARLGGDEFIVVLDGVNSEIQATRIAQRLIEDVRFPVMLESGPVSVGASIGIAITTLDGTNDTESVIRFADAAMYAAKEDKNERIRVFDNKLKSIVEGRHEVESSIRGATERGEIIDVLQPLVNVEDLTTYGYEELCRWSHPVFGVLAPGQFLNAAKVTGEIIEIDRWMVNKAFKNSIDIAAASQKNTRIWVNLSVRHLLQGEFYQHVLRALRDSEISAEMLGVEIEEEVFKVDNGLLYPFLNQLRDLGIAIALDDFGSEEASLQSLKRYKYDAIKLDRTLIRDHVHNPGTSIVPAVVELARTQGSLVIATGVETSDQFNAMSEIGCQVVQGYIFSEPKPLRELIDREQSFSWQLPLGVKRTRAEIQSLESDTVMGN